MQLYCELPMGCFMQCGLLLDSHLHVDFDGIHLDIPLGSVVVLDEQGEHRQSDGMRCLIQDKCHLSLWQQVLNFHKRIYVFVDGVGTLTFYA